LIWLFLDAILAMPDPLGWQNEIGWIWNQWTGKPALIGDSLDWGQDMARLSDWIGRHSRERSTIVCIYGLGDGEAYGLQPPRARSNSDVSLPAEYLAASENVLLDYQSRTCIRIAGATSRLSAPECEALLRIKPFTRVGRTIRVYRLADLPAGQFPSLE
jgi:hypothetical protein